MPKTIYSVQIKDNCTLVHDENGYYHLVYKIVNTVNGKIYIGKHSTKNPYDEYFGSGIAINSAIEKYGIENFSKEILFCFTDEKEAFLKESEIVDENFVKRSDTYNMKCGGDGFGSGKNNPMYNVHRYGKDNPFFNKKHSEETRLRMTLNHADFSGEKNPMYGKHLPQEAKDKISKANKGKFVGEKSPMYGKHPSKEARELMRKNHANVSGNNNPNAKSVLKLDKHGNIITKYETIKDCRNQEHISRRKLNNLIKEHILYNGFYFVIETSKRLF